MSALGAGPLRVVVPAHSEEAGTVGTPATPACRAGTGFALAVAEGARAPLWGWGRRHRPADPGAVSLR
ncbi:hypothetical protein ACF061_11630 [Streptomyces sp. NPDC015220]|uniref:hypothetical protein n=1 Tax=Streptomyces sp. NPDC015220 TaxID=3364947 RepID=UPI0036F6108B